MTPNSHRTAILLLLSSVSLSTVLAGCKPNSSRLQAELIEQLKAENERLKTENEQLKAAKAAEFNASVSMMRGQVTRAKQSEAKQYVGATNRAQQFFHLDYDKFATNLKDLGVRIRPETENYKYEIVTADNQQTQITAAAKTPELKSYRGAVFTVKSQDNLLETLAVVCETDAPSPTPPALVRAPATSNEEIQCPAGSSNPLNRF